MAHVTAVLYVQYMSIPYVYTVSVTLEVDVHVQDLDCVLMGLDESRSLNLAVKYVCVEVSP